MMSTVSFKDKLKQAYSVFKWDLKSCTGTMAVYAILAAVFTTIILTLCLVIGFYIQNSMDNSLTIYSFFETGDIFIVSACLGQPVVNEAVMVYSKLIMGTLASISAYGLISVCCGTTINSVIMFIAVCVAYPISAMFVKGVVNGFFCGMYTGIFRNHFIMNALNPLAAYDGVNIVYWLIFSAVCIVSSALLAKNRKAERAQASFAYYLPCHLVKVLVAFLTGMFLGVLFGSLNVFGNGFLGFVFGFILGSVPAFIIAHLIFYKGFSRLIKTSIPLGGLVVVVVAVMAFCCFDVFGYNEFVPKFDNVRSAGMIDSKVFSKKYKDNINKTVRESAEDFTDRESVNTIISAHNSILEDKEFTFDKKFQRVWYDMLVDNISFGVNEMQYGFAYKMNDGRVITRTYSHGLDSVITYSDSLDIDDIIRSKTYIEKYSNIFNSDIKDIGSIIVRTEENAGCTTEDSDKSDRDYKKVLEAFKKDFEADKGKTAEVLSAFDYPEDINYYLSSTYVYKNFDYLKKEYPDAVCLLEVNTGSSYSNDAEAFSAFFNGNFSVYDVASSTEVYLIPESYTNTIKAMKDIGVLNEDNTINKFSDYYKALFEYH